MEHKGCGAQLKVYKREGTPYHRLLVHLKNKKEMDVGK